MLLHKSTHHFDIINWLLGDEPQKVTALANRVYYSDKSKCFGERCKDCSHKKTCESALSQSNWDRRKLLSYTAEDAEKDGYTFIDDINDQDGVYDYNNGDGYDYY